jgi:hypothetical protein
MQVDCLGSLDLPRTITAYLRLELHSKLVRYVVMNWYWTSTIDRGLWIDQ